jgi:sterol desaturase/sphingolipid hydroxylase (fatty acid hydroxylase superfamily)
MEWFGYYFEHYMRASEGDPVAWFVPFFLVSIGIELGISTYQKRALYVRDEALASIGMGIGVIFVGLLMKFLALVAFLSLYQLAPASWKAFLAPGNWWTWVLIFFADDFSFYWHHRLSHTFRVLWCAHENHHSSKTLNLATALRQSWSEQFYKYIFWLWMPLVGFDPIMMLAMMSISLIYQFFQHTELVGKLPRPIEWIFNTPSHHRVHHATNIQYLDRNHAGILIIWDRMFGTFVEEDPNDPPVYGTRKGAYYTNLFRIAFHEYADLWKDVRNAPDWKTRWNYLFQAPGWQPGDITQTTPYLQKQWAEAQRNQQRGTAKPTKGPKMATAS